MDTEMKEARRTRSLRKRHGICAGLDVGSTMRFLKASGAEDQAKAARLRMAEEMAKIDRALDALEANEYTVVRTGRMQGATKVGARKCYRNLKSGSGRDYIMATSTTREGLKAIMARRFPDHTAVTHHGNANYVQIVTAGRGL